MQNEKITTTQTIERLVKILNNPKNKEIIRANQEYSKAVSDWYETELEKPIPYFQFNI